MQLGVINTTYAAIDAMSKSKGERGGIVLTVASVASFDCSFDTPGYTATKHGVIGFMRCFGVKCLTQNSRNQLKLRFVYLQHTYYNKHHGIKFLSICPGITETALADKAKRIQFDETDEWIANKRIQT